MRLILLRWKFDSWNVFVTWLFISKCSSKGNPRFPTVVDYLIVLSRIYYEWIIELLLFLLKIINSNLSSFSFSFNSLMSIHDFDLNRTFFNGAVVCGLRFWSNRDLILVFTAEMIHKICRSDNLSLISQGSFGSKTWNKKKKQPKRQG